MTTFNDFDFPEQLMENLRAKNYENPTDVQAAAIPEILNKKDVVLQSHTGSGKTAAFGLPLIRGVMADVPAVQYLVLVPTRELAVQVRDELTGLSEGMGVKVCSIYGGSDMKAQIKALRDGAQIVVGTPGRVIDHLKRRTMSFSVVRAAVLDEADKMLSMGFLPDVTTILQRLPKRRQMVMSSATFPYSIEQLIHGYMEEPVRLTLSSDDRCPKELEHIYCAVQTNEKEPALLAFLEKEQPEFSLIFCNTKVDVKSVHYFLNKAGIKAEGLSSEMSQRQRERALSNIRNGISQHMVCTDLAARGIDIPALTHVFNFSSSNDAETYVHRTGRTGRAGKKGKAISLVSTLDLAGFQNALRTHGIEAVEAQVPNEEEIVTARTARDYKFLEDMGFAKDADVGEEFSRLAEMLSDEQTKSLLPLLLEHFRRPVTVVQAPGTVEPLEERSEGEGEREDDGRGRRGRNRGRGGRERGGRDRGGRDRGGKRERGERGDRNDRNDRNDRGGRRDRGRRRDETPREEGSEETPISDIESRPSRERGGRDGGRDRGARGRRGGGRSKEFSTVCIGLGRLDGLDEMDIQSILRRQGKARMDDIGDISMKDHESFVNIGENSLSDVLHADGKFFKSFELFVGKSPVPLDKK